MRYPQKARKIEDFRFEWIDLLRPNTRWPAPLSVEQAFETMRWLVRTGQDRKYLRSTRYGERGVVDLLNADTHSSAGGFHPITSLEDLRKRFHWAVLAVPDTDGQEIWRYEHGIDVGAAAAIAVPTYKPGAGARHLGFDTEESVRTTLESMQTGERGAEMAVRLNPSHPDCNVLQGFEIAVGPDRIWFNLRYGSGAPEFAYTWRETVAFTREGESFLDAFSRARDVYDCLVHGKPNEADLSDMDALRYGPRDFVTDQVEQLARPQAAAAPRP